MNQITPCSDFQRELLEATRDSYKIYEDLCKLIPEKIGTPTSYTSYDQFDPDAAPETRTRIDLSPNPEWAEMNRRFRVQIAAIQALIPVAIDPTLAERAVIASILKLRGMQMRVQLEEYMSPDVSRIVWEYARNENVGEYISRDLTEVLPSEAIDPKSDSITDLEVVMERMKLLILQARLARRAH